MLEDRATYSISAIQQCWIAYKQTSFTVRRKEEHYSKEREIFHLYDLCYQKTDCILFDPYHDSPSRDYTRAADNFKNHTKKELDALLKRCKRDLEYQIVEISKLIDSGEVNVID